MRARTKQFLRRIGIPANINGNNFLCISIEIYLDYYSKNSKPIRFTVDVYPELGKRFNTTAYAADRAMRTAISKMSLEEYSKIIGFDSSKIPTVSEFVSQVSDMLKYNYI